MIRYTLGIATVLLCACQGTDFQNGNNVRAKLVHSAAEVTDSAPEATVVSPEGQQQAHAVTGDIQETVIPDAAITPTAISGASLTCTLVEGSPDEAKCVASSMNNQSLNFTVANAYTIFGDNTNWRPIAFRSFATTGLNPNTWIVSLPVEARNKSVAIVLSNENQNILADWIINEADKPVSFALDGGFEEHVLDSSNLLPNQFIVPERQTSWKAINANQASTCRNLIETQSTFTTSELIAIEGSQWIELDSSCNGDYKFPGNNITVYQDLNLDAGHFYEISFYYKVRLGGTSLQAFTASLGTQILFAHDVSEKDWTRVSMVVLSPEAKPRISFTETGDPQDGRGTLLDDIEIRDLGPALGNVVTNEDKASGDNRVRGGNNSGNGRNEIRAGDHRND